jgi:hypothetical protein
VKKLIAILIAVVMTLTLALPVMASVGTGVEVVSGGSDPPVIKCKWETPDDGDPTHIDPGTQVYPPMQYDALKDITIFVVVTDDFDKGEVSQVVADVWHPEGPPEYGSLKKDNLSLSIMSLTAGMSAFESGVNEGLIVYYDEFDYAEVIHELEQGYARVWCVTWQIHYHQPAGDYLVEVTALDSDGIKSTTVQNYFEYVAVSGIEIDFDSITYPNVKIGRWSDVGGNMEFVPGDGMPTVRSIGNTNNWLYIVQDDMNFGDYEDGRWKVTYDARLGPQADDNDSTKIYYDPYEKMKFPNMLPKCNTMKLDFSIHPIWGDDGSYTGTMEITSEIAPWVDQT